MTRLGRMKLERHLKTHRTFTTFLTIMSKRLQVEKPGYDVGTSLGPVKLKNILIPLCTYETQLFCSVCSILSKLNKY